MEDVTAATGVGMERRLPFGFVNIEARQGGGVCVIDVDGVPPLDLFLADRVDGSRLFVGSGSWRWSDETDARGLALSGDAVGCLAFDADQDGRTDLLVTGIGTLRLYLREGEGFVEGSALLSANIENGHLLASAAAGDVDGDRDIDLVVAGFVDGSNVLSGNCQGIPCEVIAPIQPWIRNRVFLREPSGYVELIDAGPLSLNESTLVIGIADFDGEGTSEVYVGNDSGDRIEDRVVKFEAGVVVDVSDRFGMAHDSRGHGIDTMGFTLGDVNGDRRFDVAVTPFQGFHSPIFLCGEDGFCEDQGLTLGTGAGSNRLRWGNALVDLDLDGDVDLFEAAGHVFTDEEGSAGGFSIDFEQRPVLLENTEGRFEPATGTLSAYDARGIAVADLDDDGSSDIVLTRTREGPIFLRNVRAPVFRSLRVLLRGRAPNTDAVGATLTLRTSTSTQIRQKIVGEGYLGNFDPRIFFALPEGESAELSVRWPSGSTQVLTSIAAGELIVEEP